MGDGPAQDTGPSLRGEVVAASTAASSLLLMYAAFFCCLNHRPASTSLKWGQRALTSARRRYRAACPSPAPPRISSVSQANSLAPRAAACPGSMPRIASKSSMALSNRAAYMRAIPLL